MNKQTSHWRSAIQVGLKSVKATWPSMLVIQAVTAAIVIAYFTIPTFAQSLNELAALQASGGLLFVFISGLIAGGILPEIAKVITKLNRKFDSNWVKETCYTGFVYGIIAILVYYLYIILAGWFGEDLSFQTAAPKVVFDMLVFSPFLSIPFATGMFIWRRDKFNLKSWQKVILPRHYRTTVLPGLVLCWAFWVPVLSAIYCLPLKLQFPVAILCESAWTIVFVFNVKEAHADPVLVE